MMNTMHGNTHLPFLLPFLDGIYQRFIFTKWMNYVVIIELILTSHKSLFILFSQVNPLEIITFDERYGAN